MRDGKIGFQIDGIYRPRGHLGDFTGAEPKTYSLNADTGRLTIGAV